MSGRRFRPAVVGVAGATLSAEERALFRELPPAGVILFARNCLEPEQLEELVVELRALFPDRRLPLFVDQEGGRVQRLRPPHWPALPAAGTIGRLFDRDPRRGRQAARLYARAIAATLAAADLDVVCAPVLDLHLAETTAAIGERSFGGDPHRVAALGRIVCDTLRSCGIAPVIKHLPGHGRARCDSHLELPRVDARADLLEASDFVPFRACRDAPFAMTCHCLFEALDPRHPASLSAPIVREVVRGRLGFCGILLSDDLGMGALVGSPKDRARAAWAAGSDLVLWCDGDVGRTAEVLAALPEADTALEARLAAALASARRPETIAEPRDLARQLADTISAADARDP